MSWAPKGTVPGMVDPQVAQAVMANLAGAGTLREVLALMDATSPNTAHRTLRKAAELELVHFGGGSRGTLRGPAMFIVQNWGQPPAA